MNWYYGHIFKYTDQVSCFDSFKTNQDIVLNAVNLLNNYVSGVASALEF